MTKMKTKEWIEFEFEGKTYEVQKEIYGEMNYLEAEKIAKENDWKMLNVLQAGYIYDEKIIKDFCKKREWLEHYSKLTKEEGLGCSALGGNWDCYGLNVSGSFWDGGRLYVYGNGWNGGGVGHSFGVRFIRLKEEIKELENKEQEEFESIIYNNKEFRIYKWTKPISELVNKDFTSKIKGYRLSEFQEFNELIESKKIELEIYKFYFVKHWNKLQHNKTYCLSRCYLYRLSSLISYDSGLSNSYVNGRVVLVRVRK